MMRQLLTLMVLCFAAGCSPRTGINTAACQRAEEDLRAAMSASAPDFILQRRLQEMERACEIDASGANPAATQRPAIPQQAPAERPVSANTFFVSTQMTEERSSPGGEVVNRIYRGQRVEVTDRQGSWVRVTEMRYDPRWVKSADLSRVPPAPLEQPEFDADLNDARIQGIPSVGENGLNERDVRALRTASAQLLASGQCRSIEYGDKSVDHTGIYYVNCGENSNRFFHLIGDRPRFCGRSASSCSR